MLVTGWGDGCMRGFRCEAELMQVTVLVTSWGEWLHARLRLWGLAHAGDHTGDRLGAVFNRVVLWSPLSTAMQVVATQT
eukprot:1149245-Pelagomonas_calceolata.AAC.1